MEIQTISTRQNDDDQSIAFTLTDDSGTAYDWRCDAPKDVDPQAYLEANKEKFLYLILGKMYPGAPKHETLEERRQWIADGAWIPAVTNDEGEEIEPARQIDRQPWAYEHPAIIPATGTELDQMIADAKQMIDSMTYASIGNHIDTVFGNLNTAQKNSLKWAYRLIWGAWKLAVIHFLRK